MAAVVVAVVVVEGVVVVVVVTFAAFITLPLLCVQEARVSTSVQMHKARNKSTKEIRFDFIVSCPFVR